MEQWTHPLEPPSWRLLPTPVTMATLWLETSPECVGLVGAGHSWSLLVLVCTIILFLSCPHECIICPSVVDCGPLTDPTNGMVDIPTTTFESTATYSCTNNGYTLNGDMTRTCLATGDWSGSEPACDSTLIISTLVHCVHCCITASSSLQLSPVQPSLTPLMEWLM